MAQALTAAPPAQPLPVGPGPQVAPGLPPTVTGGAPAASPARVTIPPLFSPSWFDGVKYGAQVEGGFSFNGDRPADGLNTGQLTTDHANQAQLNQLLLTVQRVTDPKAAGYDFGFAFQAMYGSDVRFYHFVDELDRT
ncbi:MAG: outer membrane beta-barrel protein, partial [Janthinobacterium lividum]